MKNLKLILLLCCLSILTFACGGGGENQTQEDENTETTNIEENEDSDMTGAFGNTKLTDALVKKYITLIKDIKKENKDLDNENLMTGIANLNVYLKKHGFDGMEQFMSVHTKVIAGYAYLMAEKEKVVEKYEESQDKAITELKKQLEDENISEIQKTQLKQTLEMMEKTQEEGGMKDALESMQKGYGAMTSEEEQEIIKKNMAELKKALGDK
jgi:hypothetical protein